MIGIEAKRQKTMTFGEFARYQAEGFRVGNRVGEIHTLLSVELRKRLAHHAFGNEAELHKQAPEGLMLPVLFQ